jgi:hypothetical protein
MIGSVVRITDPAFGAMGQSVTATVYGSFNVTIWGIFSGTVAVERAVDGVNFVAVGTDGLGTAASFTSPITVTGFEPESGVFYRFNCTAYVSGTIHCRLSQIMNDYHPSKAYSRLS